VRPFPLTILHFQCYLFRKKALRSDVEKALDEALSKDKAVVSNRDTSITIALGSFVP
jgi:hypothetical protein